MEQTNVVQMPEQKPERDPWLRNPDIPTEQEQLSDLEERLRKEISDKNMYRTANLHLGEKIAGHNSFWNSFVDMLQEHMPDSVDEDKINEMVDLQIDANDDIVTHGNLEEKVSDAINNLNFSVTVE